jgi:DNA polymerase-1
MPIQGTAADMIKLAMIRIDSDFTNENLKSSMLLQVHDELVFEVYKKEIETVRSIIGRNMKEALPLSVPIEVDVGVGKTWLEAH